MRLVASGRKNALEHDCGRKYGKICGNETGGEADRVSGIMPAENEMAKKKESDAKEISITADDGKNIVKYDV